MEDKEFFISNEIDVPHHELVCYKAEDGLRYVNSNDLAADQGGGTPLALFGFESKREGNIYKFKKTSHSVALTKTLRHRPWEGLECFELEVRICNQK